MKKFSQFLVLSSDFMLTNRPQQGGVCVPLMLDEILQHGEHGRYFVKRTASENPESIQFPGRRHGRCIQWNRAAAIVFRIPVGCPVETAGRRLRVSQSVSVVRPDHVPAQEVAPGMREASLAGHFVPELAPAPRHSWSDSGECILSDASSLLLSVLLGLLQGSNSLLKTPGAAAIHGSAILIGLERASDLRFGLSRRVYVWWNKMRKPRLVAAFRIRSTD
jgi:hypothetical protein